MEVRDTGKKDKEIKTKYLYASQTQGKEQKQGN